MSDTPKFLSKQELELQEVNYIFSLRAERDELQEQLNTAKKALTEISKTKVPFRNGCFHWEDFSEDALKAQKALAAIGGDDD